MLQYLKSVKFPGIVEVEYDYPIPEGSNSIAEVKKCVQYMKDAAAQNGQDTSIAKIFTAKQQLAIKNNISTDWQKAVLRTGLQRSLQGGANGGSGDTRYALNGNYFGQQGLIPGQGYTRGSAFA